MRKRGFKPIFVKSWSVNGDADDRPVPQAGHNVFPVKLSGPTESGVTHHLEFETWAVQFDTGAFG